MRPEINIVGKAVAGFFQGFAWAASSGVSPSSMNRPEIPGDLSDRVAVLFYHHHLVARQQGNHDHRGRQFNDVVDGITDPSSRWQTSLRAMKYGDV